MPSEYEVIVCTGDRLGAGTDAAVTLEVRGQSGTASRHTLPQGRALFERRSVDSFRLLLSEGVGAVASVRAWTDGAGLGSDWLLSHVDVEQLATGDRHCETKPAWKECAANKMLCGVLGRQRFPYSP